MAPSEGTCIPATSRAGLWPPTLVMVTKALGLSTRKMCSSSFSRYCTAIGLRTAPMREQASSTAAASTMFGNCMVTMSSLSMPLRSRRSATAFT